VWMMQLGQGTCVRIGQSFFYRNKVQFPHKSLCFLFMLICFRRPSCTLASFLLKQLELKFDMHNFYAYFSYFEN
jgi:hypothetical protein